MPGLTWDPRPGLPAGWNHILNKCMEPGWPQPVGCREPIRLLLTSRGHTRSMGSLHCAPLGSLQQARGRSRPSVEHDLPGGADLPLGQHRAASVCGRWGPPLVEDARRGLSTRKSQALGQGQGESAWPCWPSRGQNPSSRHVPRARPGPLCLHHSPTANPSTAPNTPRLGTGSMPPSGPMTATWWHSWSRRAGVAGTVPLRDLTPEHEWRPAAGGGNNTSTARWAEQGSPPEKPCPVSTLCPTTLNALEV